MHYTNHSISVIALRCRHTQNVLRPTTFFFILLPLYLYFTNTITARLIKLEHIVHHLKYLMQWRRKQFASGGHNVGALFSYAPHEGAQRLFVTD